MTRAALSVALLTILGTSSMAYARKAAPPPAPPSERLVISAVVYGEDLCPLAQGDEIVVCARKPEGERYRIPEDLRRHMVSAGPQSWTSRVAAVEAESRRVLPGSCSPMGSNGQTGCARAAGQRWFLERQQQKRENAIP